MAALVDYCLDELPRPAPPACDARRDEPAIRLLHQVVARMADLAAVVHGRGLRPRRAQHRQHERVTGESFDYGPVALAAATGTPASPPPISTIRASMPSAASPRRSTGTVAQLGAGAATRWPTPNRWWMRSNRFPELYADAMRRRFCWRLGIAQTGAEDVATLMEAAVRGLMETRTPIDRFYFDWRGRIAAHGGGGRPLWRAGMGAFPRTDRGISQPRRRRSPLLARRCALLDAYR
jgi:hypothetical protein